jgi:hypothetical protein
MVKLIIITDEGKGPILQKIIIKNETIRTEKVLAERSATTQELLLYHTGYGRMIKF